MCDALLSGRECSFDFASRHFLSVVNTWYTCTYIIHKHVHTYTHMYIYVYVYMYICMDTNIRGDMCRNE